MFKKTSDDVPKSSDAKSYLNMRLSNQRHPNTPRDVPKISDDIPNLIFDIGSVIKEILANLLRHAAGPVLKFIKGFFIFLKDIVEIGNNDIKNCLKGKDESNNQVS